MREFRMREFGKREWRELGEEEERGEIVSVPTVL